MKKILLTIVLAGMISFFHAQGQQINGQSLTFSKGKTEWSDTLFRRLLTKQMAKEGIHPVLIAIRCKFLNKEAEGSWYQIEITN
ncbi:MAG: hypothetical protein Q8867_10500, partial [Bacteroidota bacterium]|nr:hypothetical protein [Bacteroidota bacterium]